MLPDVPGFDVLDIVGCCISAARFRVGCLELPDIANVTIQFGRWIGWILLGAIAEIPDVRGCDRDTWQIVTTDGRSGVFLIWGLHPSGYQHPQHGHWLHCPRPHKCLGRKGLHGTHVEHIRNIYGSLVEAIWHGQTSVISTPGWPLGLQDSHGLCRVLHHRLTDSRISCQVPSQEASDRLYQLRLYQAPFDMLILKILGFDAFDSLNDLVVFMWFYVFMLVWFLFEDSQCPVLVHSQTIDPLAWVAHPELHRRIHEPPCLLRHSPWLSVSLCFLDP